MTPFEGFVLRDRDFYTEESRHFKQVISLGFFRRFNKQCLVFFSFLTDLGVPITLSICFSNTKGERDVVGLSSCDWITIDLGNVLLLKMKCGDWSASSSDSVVWRILVLLIAMIVMCIFQWLCTSPSMEPYKGTFNENGSPIPNAKAT